MLHTPFELEYLAEAHRSDLLSIPSGRHPGLTTGGAGSPSPLRLAVGLRLIALGERLAGRREQPGAGTSAPLRPAGSGLR